MTSDSPATAAIQTLKVLLIEDCDDDATLLQETLRAGGIAPIIQRVQNQEEFEAAVGDDIDLIVSDYRLPIFSGMEALKILHGRNLDIPFIVVSGGIGEEVAVEMMRAGANDYVFKDNLRRLVPAIIREVKEARSRREREQELRASRSHLHKFRQAGKSIRDELRRHKLGKLEVSLIELIIEISYGWGRDRVHVPRLEIFSTFTGQSRSNIHVALAALVRCKILEMEDADPGAIYRVNPDSESWKATPHGISVIDWRKAITELRVYNKLDKETTDEFGGPHFFDEPPGTKILTKCVMEGITVMPQLSLFVKEGQQ